jgi:hypothetical protein
MASPAWPMPSIVVHKMMCRSAMPFSLSMGRYYTHITYGVNYS